MSHSNGLNSNEIKGLFNSDNAQFERLHPEVQGVINKRKWTAMVDKLSRSFEKNDSSSDMLKFLPIVHPVLSLSEWLKDFKKV